MRNSESKPEAFSSAPPENTLIAEESTFPVRWDSQSHPRRAAQKKRKQSPSPTEKKAHSNSPNAAPG